MRAVRVGAIRYIACAQLGLSRGAGDVGDPAGPCRAPRRTEGPGGRLWLTKANALASQRPGKLLKEAANRRDGFPPSARLADARRAVSREQQIS
jgi:hypothetical protein